MADNEFELVVLGEGVLRQQIGSAAPLRTRERATTFVRVTPTHNNTGTGSPYQGGGV